MKKDDLEYLFTKAEMNRFMSLVESKKYYFINSSVPVECIQNFILFHMEEVRRMEIIDICLIKYPQVIGLKSDMD
jgi:hypothetical protein